jgi:hypothetical protein
MSQIDDLVANNSFLKGVALGLGAAVLVPVAALALAPVARPMMRGALKAGILAYEKGREAAAELAEMVDDLVAEVQEELREERAAAVVARPVPEAGDTPDTQAEPERAG